MDIKQSIATIVFVILIIILIPLPINEKQSTYENVGYIEGSKEWEFVRLKEGGYTGMYGQNYPVFYVGTRAWGPEGFMCIITTPDSESYIEATFVVPKRGTVFAYDQPSGSRERYYIELCDSNGVIRPIDPLPCLVRDKTTMYDISPYVGQEVTIRIRQSSDLASKHWRYGGMRVINKPYTLWDNFNLFINMLKSVLLVSLLIGAVAGVSGLEIISKAADKIQTLIHENKASGMGFENKYVKGFLSMALSILDAPMRAADGINNTRLHTGIKIASVLFMSFAIIYVTYVAVYTIVIVVLALLILAAILWIIAQIIGASGSPSIGGSGGSGGGGGKDYTTKYGKTYDPKTGERVVKQDGKTYRRGSIFELDAGLHADKEWTGGDKVERDWDGSPKIRRDVTGKQIIEGDSSGNPIIEPESERDK